MANSIEKYRRAQKMSMEALGQAIGTDASTINKIEKEKIKASPARLSKMADLFGVSIEDLLADPDDSPAPPLHGHRITTPHSDRPQIEVLGAAAGSLLSGAFQLTPGPIEFIDVPTALENMRGLYALYIDGNSMWPMYPHGSKVIVSIHRPVSIGNSVVIQERRAETAPMMASIGILHVRTPEKIVIKKINPPAEIEFSTRHIESVHKVLDYADLIAL